MQKIVFYVGSLGLCSLLLTACEKEEIVPNTVVSETVDTKNSQVMDKSGGRPENAIWFDNGNPNGSRDIDYGCRDSGGNCINEVVVTAKIKADIRGIGEVILHGSAPQIIDEFKNKRHVLEPIIGTSHVQGVINSALTPDVRGIDDDVIYLVFYNKPKTKVLMVYPVH